MRVGRELDRLIAEEIMGLKTEYYGGNLVEKTKLNRLERVYTIDYVIPKYSTDIAAAWKIVEKLANTTHSNFGVYSFIRAGRVRHMRYTVRFTGETNVEVTGRTVPEAICFAALDTIGYTSPDR